MTLETSAKKALLFIICAVFCAAFFGCSHSNNSSTGSRGSTTDFPVPQASGKIVYSSDGVTIDASNTSKGYIMTKYSGPADKIKVQITGSDSETYTYTATAGDYVTFPLTAGNGNYKIDVLENIKDDAYTLALSKTISVSLKNEFEPFLYPNQYVWFTKGMKSMDLGVKLSEKSADDLDYVEKVYDYVIKHIDYDNAKAKNIPLDYIPIIDDTLETKKGICFDYASLMASLLRSQGIPTKLVVGYSGRAYHAWISVYTKETGWVDDIIKFDGKDWSLMDPTLASSNDKGSVKEYIGSGNNYIAKYFY